MTLHFALRVGGRSVGYFEAQRVDGCTCTRQTDVHTYRVRVTRYATADTPATTATAEVVHQYGDGEWMLVARGVAATRKELAPWPTT